MSEQGQGQAPDDLRIFMAELYDKGDACSLEEAFRLAVEVHGAQLDKAGEPYLFHVMRVAMQMPTHQARAVAILHDVFEDARWSFRHRHEVYARVGYLYGKDVFYALFAITRQRDEPYDVYIERVAKNPLATTVKIADLIDNLSYRRMESLSAEDRNELTTKYRAAYSRLAGKVYGGDNYA